MKGGCIPSENKFKAQINNKLRWLASNINFKLLHTGCPIAHGLEWNVARVNFCKTEDESGAVG